MRILQTSKDQKKEMVCKYIDGFQILNNGEIVKVSHPECYPINIKKMRKDEAKKVCKWDIRFKKYRLRFVSEWILSSDY